MAGNIKEKKMGKPVMSNMTPVKGGQPSTNAEGSSMKGKDGVEPAGKKVRP